MKLSEEWTEALPELKSAVRVWHREPIVLGAVQVDCSVTYYRLKQHRSIGRAWRWTARLGDDVVTSGWTRSGEHASTLAEVAGVCLVAVTNRVTLRSVQKKKSGRRKSA